MDDNTPRIDSVEMESIIGRIFMEWTDLEESIHGGDYDPDDPNDMAVLRLDAEYYPKGGEEREDASYCTQVPADAPQHVRDRLLVMACELCLGELANDRSLDKTMQRLSWIEESWLTDGPKMPA